MDELRFKEAQKIYREIERFERIYKELSDFPTDQGLNLSTDYYHSMSARGRRIGVCDSDQEVFETIAFFKQAVLDKLNKLREKFKEAPC